MYRDLATLHGLSENPEHIALACMLVSLSVHTGECINCATKHHLDVAPKFSLPIVQNLAHYLNGLWSICVGRHSHVRSEMFAHFKTGVEFVGDVSTPTVRDDMGSFFHSLKLGNNGLKEHYERIYHFLSNTYRHAQTFLVDWTQSRPVVLFMNRYSCESHK